MSESKTPRTDVAARPIKRAMKGTSVVYADKCREIESELSEANRKLAQAEPFQRQGE